MSEVTPITPAEIMDYILGKPLEEMFIKFKPVGYYILENDGKELYRPNRIRVEVDNGIIVEVLGRG